MYHNHTMTLKLVAKHNVYKEDASYNGNQKINLCCVIDKGKATYFDLAILTSKMTDRDNSTLCEWKYWVVKMSFNTEYPFCLMNGLERKCWFLVETINVKNALNPN